MATWRTMLRSML